MLRLFFALQPTPAQCEALLVRAAPLVVATSGQPVTPANFHATLSFIGAVPLQKLDVMRETAARVRGAPVTLRFDAFEYWDSPRVLCATATQGSASAMRLAQDLTMAAIAAGFAPDGKPFRPHLTLARKLNAATATLVEWPQALTPVLTLRCDRFVLMESRRSEAGSSYSVVESWPLDGNEPL